MDRLSNSITCRECKKISRCFRKLLPSELDFIDHHKIQIDYSKRENICKQNAFASSIIYILQGLVKLLIEGPNNRNYILSVLKPSEFVGFSSLFGENKYHYSAVALTNSTVCLMEKDSIKKLIRENNEFSNEIIEWYLLTFRVIACMPGIQSFYNDVFRFYSAIL